MSLFSELRRRNVIRVGISYLVASWLLLQITDVLMSVLNLPETVGKAVFLVLVIGFIPAIIFAWAFELTPEGLKRDSAASPDDSTGRETARKLDTAVIIMLIAVAALVAWDRFVPQQSATNTLSDSESKVSALPAEADSPASNETDLTASDAMTSIAVLPFTNMSPDPDNEYFADGVSEELLNLLVDIEGLRVPSRTSSFSFKDTNLDIRDIADQLEVDHILEGSVRKAGNRVRITAQLIDVSTDTHLWSETYDRELADIFFIQDEIAGRIVAELKLALSMDNINHPTDNLEAYTLYLHGRELLRGRDADGLVEADQLLEEATTLDPEFADAWAARATVQIVLPGYIKSPAKNFQSAALNYAQRALDIEPGHPEATLAIGEVFNATGRVADAIARLEAVVLEQPGHATGRLWLAIALAKSGYLSEAFEQVSVARSLDPVHPTVLDWYARIAPMAGAADQVVPTAQRALRLGRPQARVPLFQYLIGAGNRSDMANFVDTAEDPQWLWMLQIFDVRDNPETFPDALADVAQAEQQGAGYITNYMRLNLQMVAGESEAFFEQVRIVDPVDSTIGLVVWLSISQRHRQHPAMQAWINDAGLDELWRERGNPDFCQAVDEGDFICH